MNRSRIAAASVMLLTAMGCGSDHKQGGVTFVGTVTSVTPQQAMREVPARRWLAKVESLILPSAVAQSSCPAKHVLACASNGVSPEACERVDIVDCGFSVSVPATLTAFAGGAFGFVDDANDNAEQDSGETIAFLFEDLGRLCEGTVVKLDDVSIDFTPGSAHATAGSVRKDPDTCPNVTPGPSATSTPGPSPTPTPYSVAAPLNPPPSTMLAMLYGAGAVGLLLPVRRRRRRE
jgi:hypothetical protein